jgi:hypothetical protein
MTLSEIEAARRDPVVFADKMIGRPLWDHQIEVVRSDARYRVICAGRRAGKSHVYGVLALHGAFSRPGFKVLIVSAGDTAAKRLFAEIAAMAKAPKLGPSTEDETTSTLTLSNGSTIECVPASMRQVRSAEADLLIVDEAGFVAQEIWEAAEPIILARPGSRVLLASTPWGALDHFFRVLWNQGKDRPDEHVRSWHWPSEVSPLVDRDLLEQIRLRNLGRPDYFEREYLALWTSDSGSYFTEAELMANVADYELGTVERARAEGWADWGVYTSGLIGGIDWGAARDSSALAVVGVLDDLGLNVNAAGRGQRLYLAALEERTDGDWDGFIRFCVDAAIALPLWVTVSETNGVGAWPTQDLQRRLQGFGPRVAPAHTDNRRKQSGYGMLKGLLQQRAIVLPSHPRLLSQLRALQFEQLPGGGMRIQVPDNLGHDDLTCMSALYPTQWRDEEYELLPTEEARLEFRRHHSLGNQRHAAEEAVKAGRLEFVTMADGFKVPKRPRPVQAVPWVWRQKPAGMETGDLF